MKRMSACLRRQKSGERTERTITASVTIATVADTVDAISMIGTVVQTIACEGSTRREEESTGRKGIENAV
jgi:hypothetical protein